MLRTFALGFLALTSVLRADLSQVRAEPNLEKRSELALEYANAALNQAKKAYEETSTDFPTQMDEVRQAVELSYQSLHDTGKAARRSPKYFKRAEMRMRALIKRLDNLEREVGLEDRLPVDEAKKRIIQVHDQVLFDIMSKK